MDVHVLDVWDEANFLFVGEQEAFPEIVLLNLDVQAFTDCILYLFQNAKESSLHFRLKDQQDVVVMAPSPEVVFEALLQEKIIAAMMFSFPIMPALVFYVHFPDTIVISFTREGWNALKAIAFFDLLDRLQTIAPTADVIPDDINFTYAERAKFVHIWQVYRNGKI